MKKTTLLSIIIPVYNVEGFLERCLNSIIRQNSDECEIILVDDGSKDNSGAICDHFCTQYQSILCIHKENGGLSDARNAGIACATGKYIWFVDSDDYIANDSLDLLISELKKNPCDVLVCQSKTVDDNLSIHDECKYSITKKMYSSYEYMTTLKLHPDSVLFCAQFHIVRRAFIEEQGFSFFKGILHEDELWTPQLLLNADKIYYSGLNIYFHYMRSGSIMHSSNMERSGLSDLIVAEKLKNIYDRSGRSEIQYLRDHMVNIYLQAVWKLPDFFSMTSWKKNEPLRNAYYPKTIAKALLYYISPKTYLYVHQKFHR